MSDAARYVGCNVTTVRREAIRDDEFSAALQRALLSVELSPMRRVFPPR